MKKKSSIVKFSILGAILLIGLILSFVRIPLGMNTFKGFAGTIKLGLDLRGGVYAVYEAEPNDGGRTQTVTSEQMNGTRLMLQNMLMSKGYSEATVVRQGNNRLRVEIPDIDDPSEILRLIGEPATLEFVAENGDIVITGTHVTRAQAGFDSESGGYVVHLSLNSEGTRRFADATAPDKHGQSIEIRATVGGQTSTISAPSINTTISNGRAIITGMRDQAAAQELADQITAGQFSVKLNRIDTAVMPPTLGARALTLGLIAGIIALILLMVFMCVFYRSFGVLSALTLLLYAVLMLFFLAALPWVQLTLPGIAGILLSLGMMVDGNIIMFERIKDEYRNGKSIKASAYAGIKKSFGAIFDADTTTVIAAVVLLIFGSSFGMGAIQSFALTLLVGVVLAMFVNLVLIGRFVKWVLPLNSTNAKMFGLKRGKGFENLQPDQTDVAILEVEAKAEEKKKMIKDSKKIQRTADGGVV
ncbi:MAG: protein translocase subunit SecD [Firmicutes bacterium]|nr:protein translocase subunit SecD [Bacillota bacterium]